MPDGYLNKWIIKLFNRSICLNFYSWIVSLYLSESSKHVIDQWIDLSLLFCSQLPWRAWLALLSKWPTISFSKPVAVTKPSTRGWSGTVIGDHVTQSYHRLKSPCVFRCAVASLWEGVSVGPSVSLLSDDCLAHLMPSIRPCLRKCDLVIFETP